MEVSKRQTRSISRASCTSDEGRLDSFSHSSGFLFIRVTGGFLRPTRPWARRKPSRQFAKKDSGAEHGKQSQNGTATVAERELGFEVDLAHSLVQFRQIEERIVAKSSRSARRF